jgi:hypothetical protein
MQLGVRQARYFGRAKTLFQLLMAATVANLTLVAAKTGRMRGRRPREAHHASRILGPAPTFIPIPRLSMPRRPGIRPVAARG